MHGVPPPPPPRIFFGRDELIEKIVHLAENLTPVALIGAGGIGKTSIALTVLHDSRTEERFGDNRWFIRCDQFPPSLAHFLNQLSKAIGAGAENPKDLTPLRHLLTSKEMLIILDNAESVLDPQGTDAQEIYTAVEELCQFNNICLLITSRISTVPPTCDSLDIPTLSMEAARDTFYRTYKSGERSDLVDAVLKQLDFHPLSITLLATIAHHNKWDTDRLTEEWEIRRTEVLHTQHNKSLTSTIELSLSSPMFQELGPNARELLGVIAFFPRGVNQKNLDWLFPTIPNRKDIFDKFCVLSLTYRYNGFVTMLAPLRDHLCPKEPKSSPLLCATKECYFDRLSVGVYPGKPGFDEARWITSEDINAEHLLDVFATIDANSGNVWDVCGYFMAHLRRHKPRLVVLGPKFEGLPDDHPSKPRCLHELADLFGLVGRHTESKRLLAHTLKLRRKWGDDLEVVSVLRALSDANRMLGLYEEGTRQGKEALEICKQLNNVFQLAHSFLSLARLLEGDKRLDAAEEAASRAIDLLPEDQHVVSECHELLGDIYYYKGETEKAIEHLEVALGIASSFSWRDQQFWIYYSLVRLFADQHRFDDAQAHVERAKSYAAHTTYLLGRAMVLQAMVWGAQNRLKEARSEALRAVDLYEKIGATKDLETCTDFLKGIDAKMNGLVTSDESYVDGEVLGTSLLPMATNFTFQAHETKWYLRWLDSFGGCIAPRSPRPFPLRYHYYPHTPSVFFLFKGTISFEYLLPPPTSFHTLLHHSSLICVKIFLSSVPFLFFCVCRSWEFAKRVHRPPIEPSTFSTSHGHYSGSTDMTQP